MAKDEEKPQPTPYLLLAAQLVRAIHVIFNALLIAADRPSPGSAQYDVVKQALRSADSMVAEVLSFMPGGSPTRPVSAAGDGNIRQLMDRTADLAGKIAGGLAESLLDLEPASGWREPIDDFRQQLINVRRWMLSAPDVDDPKTPSLH